MAKNPSSVWYWNDFLLDPALRMCSMPAQGMWMQMLGIAAAADGYVRVGDKPCSICDLATITGQDKRSVSRWVRELEKRGVFSRDEDGTIFCRRMRREAEARAAKRANGGAPVRKKSARSAHPSADTKQPELFDNPPPKPEKCADSDSTGSVATSQDSTTPVEPLPLPTALRAREGESEKQNPEGGRCAPLCRLAGSDGGPAAAAAKGGGNPDRCGEPLPPLRPPKSPALKAKIRAQLQQKHARYLQARRRPEELAAYWAAMVDDDPAVAQRALDDTDRRMRCAGWDDMRAWKREHGIAA